MPIHRVFSSMCGKTTLKFTFFLFGVFALLALGIWARQRHLNGDDLELVAMPEELPESSPTPIAKTDSTLLHFSSQRAYKYIDGEVYSFVDGIDGHVASLAMLTKGGTFTIIPKKADPRADRLGPAPDPFLIALGDQISNRTQDFWFDKESHEFFMVEYVPLSHDRTKSIIGMKLSANEFGDFADVSNKRFLLTEPILIYEGTNILNYFPETHTLLLASTWGDGCGGGGRIEALNTQTRSLRLITKLGFGCGEGPSFGGLTSDNKLILTERTKDDNLWEDDQMAGIYLLDPFTMRRTDVLADTELLKPYLMANNFFSYQPTLMKAAAGKIILQVKRSRSGKAEYVQIDPVTKQITPFVVEK